jgi:uncharacterized membrane protein
MNGEIAEVCGFQGTSSRATSINDRGQVVGSYVVAEQTYAAFLCADGLLETLPCPDTFTSCEALDITSDGAVISCATRK